MNEDNMSLFERIRRRKMLPVLVILAAGAVVWAFAPIGKNRGPEMSVTASGSIEAVEADISPKVSGRIVTMLVDEGDIVSSGQVIAILEDDEVRAQVEQTQGSLTTAQARLSELMAGTREEQIRQARANYQNAVSNAKGAKAVYSTSQESYTKSTELKAQLASAEANYSAALKEQEAAQARLALLREGPREEELTRLRANLDQAKAQFEQAEQEYRRYGSLHTQGAISNQQYENSKAARDTQRAAVDAAEARYREAQAGARPQEITEAQARLAQAKAKAAGAKQNLQAAGEIYRDRLQSRQQMESSRTNYQSADARVQAAAAELKLLLNGATRDTIEAARGQVEQAKGALAAAESRLKSMTVVSPEAGVVTSKFREVGEYVTPGSPIVRVAKMERVWLRVYAPLTSLGKIKVGQRAQVQTDTYPGKQYTGRVSSISQIPEFTPKNVQTSEERIKLVYSIRIDLDNSTGELKPGMPADAAIELTEPISPAGQVQ